MEIFDVFYKAATGLSGDGQWKIFSRDRQEKQLYSKSWL